MNSTQYDIRTMYLIARDFLSDSKVTFGDVGAMYDLSNRMVANILYYGIAENIFSTAVAESIYSKIMKTNRRGYRNKGSRWDEAFDKRSIKRQETVQKLQKMSSFEKTLEFCIQSYDVYSKRAENPLSKEELEDRLALIKKYKAKLSASLN